MANPEVENYVQTEESGRKHLLESFDAFLDLYVKEGGDLYTTSIADMIKWCYQKCVCSDHDEDKKKKKDADWEEIDRLANLLWGDFILKSRAEMAILFSSALLDLRQRIDKLEK